MHMVCIIIVHYGHCSDLEMVPVLFIHDGEQLHNISSVLISLVCIIESIG